MLMKLIELVFGGLFIAVPIIAAVYFHFTNTTNGTFANSTTINSTALGVTPFELSFWTMAPIIMVLMILVFIGVLLSGLFKPQGGQ